MDQDTLSTISTIAQVGAAVGTIAVAILAIWGDFFKELLAASPKLELELRDTKGHLIPLSDGRKTYYYRLRVTNVRKWCPARSTRVLVVRIEKRHADGMYYPVPHVDPLPLKWSHQRFHEFAPTIGTADVCNLGHLDSGVYGVFVDGQAAGVYRDYAEGVQVRVSPG